MTRRTPRVVAAAVALTSAALLPVTTVQWQANPSFLPSVLALVTMFDLIGLALLRGQFVLEGDRRLLALSAAYSWSLAVMVGYACAFPGVIRSPAPLGTWPSAAPYLWVFWHADFPLLMGLAFAPWPARWQSRVRPAERARMFGRTTAVAVASGAAVVVFVVSAESVLPSVIRGLDTTRMTTLCGPWMAVSCLVGVVLCWRGTRNRTGPERWAPVAAVAVCADVTLTLAGLHRFSAGWYGGRLLTVVAAGTVVVAMLGDVTHTRERLRVQTAQLQGLLANTDSLISVKDLQGDYLLANPALERFLGHPVLGSSPLPVPASEREVLTTGRPVRSEEVHRDADGLEHHLLTTRFLLRDPEGEPFGIGGIGTDVTELHEARQELQRRATTDSLTGLANRAGLASALGDLLALPVRGPHALVLVDLDRLKSINDTLGHAVGDAVIVEAGRRLRTVVDALPGSLAVRLGGDEFVLLLAGHGRAALLRSAERALEVLALPYTGLSEHGQSVSTSGSAGLTWIRPEHDVMSDPLHEADLALYRSKASGRGVLTEYGQELQEQTELELAQDALVRDTLRDERLRVHVRPVSDLATGAVVAVEAVPHVLRPDGSHDLPDAFLPSARRLRLIAQVDLQVLRTVTSWLADADRAPWTGTAVTHVLVPVSEVTVHSPGFTDALRELLRDVPADAPVLTLLLSEGQLAPDSTTRPLLDELALAGVRVGLDGFGAGRSSLGQARALPFDLVRLSPDVTHDLARGGRDADVARAVLALATVLGPGVLATGIDTATQRALLSEHGVTLGQGRLYDDTQVLAVIPSPRVQPAGSATA